MIHGVLLIVNWIHRSVRLLFDYIIVYLYAKKEYSIAGQKTMDGLH